MQVPRINWMLEASPMHVLMHPICSLHQVSPNSWCSNHIGWCIPARWLERICCDMQQESGKTLHWSRRLRRFDGRTSHLFATRKILVLRFLQKKCGIRCATKREILRKTLSRIRLASICEEIYHDTPSWTWNSIQSFSFTQAQDETLSHVTWLGTNSKLIRCFQNPVLGWNFGPAKFSVTWEKPFTYKWDLKNLNVTWNCKAWMLRILLQIAKGRVHDRGCG
jgi:hypothetical protein